MRGRACASSNRIPRPERAAAHPAFEPLARVDPPVCRFPARPAQPCVRPADRLPYGHFPQSFGAAGRTSRRRQRPHERSHRSRPPDPAAAAPLQFPFAEVPAPGTTLEVAPGVFWLRMPLPFALNHINLWMLRDEAGWTLVDCGLNSAPTRELWEQIFAWALPQGPIRRLIVTHYHPDHFGLAGWLTQRFGIELWMSEGEYLTARAFILGLPGYCTPSAADLFAAHGLDPAQVAHQRSRGNTYGLGVGEPPAAFRRIMDGDLIRIDGRSWQVIMGYGHAPEHAALYCAELGVLISGDMVLPKISTNVSVWAAEPNGDPLKLFLDSVDRYAAPARGHAACCPRTGRCSTACESAPASSTSITSSACRRCSRRAPVR